MTELNGRLRREHETFVRMARIYCAEHHETREGDLCEMCAYLMRYAEARLEKCPYGAEKPTCSNCAIHCYKPMQRKMAKDVMRFSGPRMSWRHPIRALEHFFDKMRRVEHPMVLRRKNRT